MSFDSEKFGAVFKAVMQGLLSLAIVAAYLYLIITSSPHAESLTTPVLGVFGFWFGQSLLNYLQAKNVPK